MVTMVTCDNCNVQSHDKEKVNQTVPLAQKVVLINLHITK